MEDRSPGEKLLEYLTEVFPSQFQGSTVQRLDDALGHDGNLVELVYWSQLFALARRLIHMAIHLAAVFPPATYGDGVLRDKIHDALSGKGALSKAQRSRITSLLLSCVEQHNREIPNRARKEAIDRSERNGSRCAYCGNVLDFSKNASDAQYTIDHIWPDSLGGSSFTENLVVVCRRCNEDRGDVINYADAHYEAISSNACSIADYLKQRKRVSDFAVRARYKFKCSSCGKPAHRTGSLLVGRIDDSDAYHFLNLAPYCAACAPEIA